MSHAPSLHAISAFRQDFQELVDAQRAFADLALVRPVQDAAAFYCDVRARGFALNRAMHNALQRGLSLEEVRSVVTDARYVYQFSDFVRRVSAWPRGYRGDFEAVMDVVTMANPHPAHRPEHYIQQFILDTAMSQQHRNKLAAQAGVLTWGLARAPDARILSIAAGAAPEFAGVIANLTHREQTIVLNDGEPEALDQAMHVFAGTGFTPIPVAGNVLRRIPQLERHGPYDCVVAGGLYDYLEDRVAGLLTRTVLMRLLKPGGRFFFTNIAHGNPFRPWMECIADWPLIERSRDQLRALVREASSDCSVSFQRETTGLVEMVTVERAGG